AEFLQRLHTSKALHGALSSSKRLMRILGAIVEPATDLLAIGVADLSHRRRVSAKPVGHELPRSAVFLHDALEKLHRRRLVSLRSDDRFQDLAFMVDSAPEIAELSVDLHKHLVQMPSPLRIRPRLRGRVRQTRQPARAARRHLSVATPLALREGPKPDTITNPSLSPSGPTSTSGRSVSRGRPGVGGANRGVTLPRLSRIDRKR